MCTGFSETWGKLVIFYVKLDGYSSYIYTYAETTEILQNTFVNAITFATIRVLHFTIVPVYDI